MFKLVGVDVFLQSETIPDVPKEHGKLALTFIANRGMRVWPGESPEMHFLDVMRCRYESEEGISDADIDELLHLLSEQEFTWSKAQKLFAKEGEKLYSQPY